MMKASAATCGSEVLGDRAGCFRAIGEDKGTLAANRSRRLWISKYKHRSVWANYELA